MKWKQATREYVSGEDLYLGAYIVGSVMYDGMKPKEDPRKYKITCLLPGVRVICHHQEDKDDAKALLERVVRHWIGKANVKDIA